MIKLFTHTDLDGVGCAVLAKIAFPINVDIEYCDYNDVNSKVKKFIDKDIPTLGEKYACLITDISVNEEVAEEINRTDIRKHFALIDHHPTSLWLNKYEWCAVDIENEVTKVKTSGTELFYRYLIGVLLPYHLESMENASINQFVRIVRDYDTWRWNELGEDGIICKQINDLFHIYGRDDFIQWAITAIENNIDLSHLTGKEELVVNLRQKEIDDYVEQKNIEIIVLPLCGMTCGIVFADRFISELGNRLCRMHPEIDFFAMIDMANKTVSYRTVKDNVDLGNDVAKLFGGGGHPKAAGSQFSNEVQKKVINTILGIE